MRVKRIIKKEEYPMVEDWSGYEKTSTRLPCKCDGCGKTVYKTISDLDKQKTCYCHSCGVNIKRKQTYLKKYGKEHPSQFPEIQNKMRQTNLEKYGEEHPMRVTEIKKKCKQTCLERYGNENPLQTSEIKEKTKRTNISRYGKEHASQSLKIREKIKRTNLERYGEENPFQVSDFKEKSKQTFLERYGEEHPMRVVETVKKGIETRRNNGTLSSSKIEDQCHQHLIKIYGESNVKRHWNKDIRYPFQVDFYIIPTDTFIECNFYWAHGKEPFDANNIEHKNILSEWKTKSGKNYKNAVDTWSVRDPLKFKTAQDNNLNYLIFYTMKEFEKYNFN